MHAHAALGKALDSYDPESDGDDDDVDPVDVVDLEFDNDVDHHSSSLSDERSSNRHVEGSKRHSSTWALPEPC